jgi:hypothetical protein
MSAQLPLFPNLVSTYPTTRYQGSKAKLADWIITQLSGLKFDTCLDAFGGTGIVAYRLKQEGKQVTYNDLLRFNYYTGVALIENSGTRLSPSDVDWLLKRHLHINYPTFVQNIFRDIYFTAPENAWIDQTIANIRQLEDPHKFAIAFFALCQACIMKRPDNLFHRKNLHLRFAETTRGSANKIMWERPFEAWFRAYIEDANRAVFDNGQQNLALNKDAAQVVNAYDLVYIDPPSITRNGAGSDYRDLYHFLEGLALFDKWGQMLDTKSENRRLKPQPSEWADKDSITAAFHKLLTFFRDSIIVVSYHSDGIPAKDDLVKLLEQYKANVRVEHFRPKRAFGKTPKSTDILLIGT